MTEKSQSTLAERLGHPRDARVLIINADDFGMCHDENLATIEGLTNGLFTSSTILVTCPWFEEAAEFARSNLGIDLGVHLTLNSEWKNYKWGPVLGQAAVPSLTDDRGYLWPHLPQVFEHDRLDEAERELRAQIDKAAAAGIDITHLDNHMGSLHLKAEFHELYVRLAHDYRLPIRRASRRSMYQLGMGSIVEEMDRLGILCPDNLIFDGPANPLETVSYWSDLLTTLKPGVTEILCHPALA